MALRGGTIMTDSGNPWIPRAAAPATGQTAQPVMLPTRELGPTLPQSGVSAPDVADRLPRRETSAQAAMWWVGAHGGAGESTLAMLAQGTRAAGHAWPVPLGRGTYHRVTVVARSNYTGLIAAQRAAIEWAAHTLGPDVQLSGLVLVADAPGRRPKELARLEQLVAGGYPKVWHMPWVEEWRFAPANTLPIPAPYRALLASLRLTPFSTHN
jgi:hypothetical protein